MSYAIITVGGKQYRVQEGERLLVDRLKTDEGKTFNPKVLLTGGNGKTDLSPSTTVTARVVSHELGEKIRIGKYKQAHRLPQAHRFPREPDADRDRVDRRGREEGRRSGEAEGRAETPKAEAEADGGGRSPRRLRTRAPHIRRRATRR